MQLFRCLGVGFRLSAMELCAARTDCLSSECFSTMNTRTCNNLQCCVIVTMRQSISRSKVVCSRGQLNFTRAVAEWLTGVKRPVQPLARAGERTQRHRMSSGSILDRLENARANMGIELTRLEKKARTSKLSQRVGSP